MSATSLQLLTQQVRRDPNNRYFHTRAIKPEVDLQYCTVCGVEPAEVTVSSDEPMRLTEAHCAAHAYLAWAEWMANL